MSVNTSLISAELLKAAAYFQFADVSECKKKFPLSAAKKQLAYSVVVYKQSGGTFDLVRQIILNNSTFSTFILQYADKHFSACSMDSTASFKFSPMDFLKDSVKRLSSVITEAVAFYGTHPSAPKFDEYFVAKASYKEAIRQALNTFTPKGLRNALNEVGFDGETLMKIDRVKKPGSL